MCRSPRTRKSAGADGAPGGELYPGFILEAREEEMVEFRRREVFEEVKKEGCWAASGKVPIDVRWIETNRARPQS
eukprot:2676106-Pyramimonas_sp.AAC.1